jgi:hypothetical protein
MNTEMELVSVVDVTEAQVTAAIERYWWTNPEYAQNANVREAMRAALEAAMTVLDAARCVGE